MALWVYFLFPLVVQLCAVHSYKVLVIVTLPGKSHGILGDGVVRHLSNAGHEVTFVTSNPQKVPPKNTRVIDVSKNMGAAEDESFDLQNMMRNKVDYGSILSLVKYILPIANATISDSEVQSMLRDPNEKFDVIILEWLYMEIFSGFSAVFNCPYIWLSSLQPHWMVLNLIDGIPSPAYIPDSTSNKSPPFTFMQRVKEFYNLISGKFVRFYMNSLEEQLYETYFVPHIKNKPKPTLEELRYNASLMFGNSHISYGEAISLPQNYKPIAGYHIDTDVKPLSEDLQIIMDNSPHGVIYFSMGSNLRSESFPEHLIKGFLDIFSELKQTVIWKFESVLLNLPKNVHIVPWAPQQSILAHPKCLLFISHGGLLSTTEAIHFGVPMIGIPVMVDQFLNVDRSVHRGFAIKVDLSDNSKSDLKEAINVILTEPRYRMKAKELSLIYHDRPVTPGAELVHWVEHVVKTQGAFHLRSPALHVPFYQKIFLDLLAVILAILITIYIASRLLSSKSVVSKEKKRC